jgi:dihydrodipicolinate synthase/N-acetylneuraminate lyase
MGMMPAFATPDAADIRAKATVDVDNLRAGVNRIIEDGMNVIATTGSFGEFHTLLRSEFETITRATVEAVNKRVPVFIGCTALNSREVVEKMEFIRDAGADGVLVGVPFYFHSSVDNAVRFYDDIATMFPTLGIMIYHNPPLHNVTLPVEAFERISANRNVVGMKDSHRTAEEFERLIGIVRGKMSIMVNQGQYRAFAPLGAAGCWSIEAWLGPWPVLALRDAINRGDDALAQQITEEISPKVSGPPDLQWRENSSKIAAEFSGYCKPGPLRPPFVEIPPEVTERARKRAAYWQELCAKYRPRVEAAATA